MLQIQELAADGLKRAFKITVAGAEIEKNLLARLAEIGKTAKIDGFRPGKAPLPVLRKRYGEAALGEIVEKTVEETVEQAMRERGLRAAMQPNVDFEEVGQGKPLVYKMAFEIMPEITLGDFTQIKLEKLTAEIADDAVDAMIERLARSVRGPESLAEPRPARTGDVLLIDFEGTAGGKPHPGMKGHNHRLELGSKSFIGDFEEQLVGVQKGDSITVNVAFPDDYHAAELAGKAAEFKVEIKDIMAHAPVVLDDALAGEIGSAGIAELRDKVRARMDEDHAQIGRELMKRSLLDQLAALYDFAVPEGLVEAEFQSIWAQIEQARARGVKTEDDDKDEAERRADYRGIAERRVRLGLLFSELGRNRGIKVEPAELRDAVIAETRKYPGQEEEAFNYFTKTPGALDRLRAPLLEEKVMNYIIAQAAVTEKKVTADELLTAPDRADEVKPQKAKKDKKSA